MGGSHGLWHQGKEGTVEIVALTLLLMFFVVTSVVLVWGLNNLFDEVHRLRDEIKRLRKDLKDEEY